MGQLEIGFTGAGSGTAPVTLGQANVLLWIGTQVQDRSDILTRFVPVPAGQGLDDIRESLAILLARHEGLRTTIQPGPHPTQTVIGSGTLVAEVSELDDDAATLLRERIRSTRYDYGRDLPLRVAVATRDGAPYLVVFALSHMAADYVSMGLLARQLTELLADPASRTVGATSFQPRDLAEREATAPARRQTEAALRFWDNHLRRLPQSVFSGPSAGEPGSREAYLSSPAAGLALPTIVARTGASRSTVLLSIAATLFAVHTDNPSAALISICGNRFGPEMAGYVGTVAQDALIPFELVGSTVDDVVRGLRLTARNSYRYAKFPAERLWAMMDAIGLERGSRFHRDCVFNDLAAQHEERPVEVRPPSPSELVEALRKTDFEWLPESFCPATSMFTVHSAGHEVRLALYGDTRYLPAPDIEALLRGVEKLVVASAMGPVAIADVAAVGGITPVRRGSGWLWHRCGWVELAAVQRLLDDVLGTPARVFTVDGALVAYVAADETVLPHEVHARCVAGLYGRYTTVAPERYVICGQVPGNPDDLDAWAALPVLAAGTGRT